MDDKKIKKIVNEIIETTTQPTILLKTEDVKTTRYDCKIGGIPYLPSTFIYPTVNESPMIFLAQINFEEFEGIEEFPPKGILQFYIANDESLGMDEMDLLNRNGFKVVYFENIEKDESKLQQPPKIDKIIDTLNNECKLIGNKGECSMDPSEYRFYGICKKYIAKYELEDDAEDDIIQECYRKNLNSRTSRMGGCASFVQSDIREGDNEMEKYTIVLLHLETEFINDEKEIIMWGDCGACNFFITPEDLKNKIFENVLFCWDN